MSTIKSSAEDLILNADGASSEVKIQQNGTTAITIDSSANVGLGVTPETWNNGGVLQIGRTSLTGQADSTGGSLNWNAYYNNGWKYKDALEANQLHFSGGSFTFNTAPSGSADAAISWTNALTINLSGGIAVKGHTSSVATTFEAKGNGDTVPVQLKVKANNGSTSTQGLYGNAGSTSSDNTIALGNSGSSGVVVDSSGIVTMPNQPAFRAYGSGMSNQTSEGNHGTWNEVFDKGNNYTAGSSAYFTAPVDGVYAFYAHSNFNISVYTPAYWRISINNVLKGVFYEDTSGGTWAHISAFITMDLSANDTIRWLYRGDPDEGAEWAQCGGYLIS